MREILFKAKRTDNGEWVEGYYLRAGTHWHKKGIHNDWIVVDAIQNGGFLNLLKRYAIDPNTLCQYTGLTDSNGVKIFEGDIVDMTGEWWDACGPAGHDSPITEVVWDDDVAGFFPFANYDCDCGVYISASGCKVIGNIHDDKEKE